MGLNTDINVETIGCSHRPDFTTIFPEALQERDGNHGGLVSILYLVVSQVCFGFTVKCKADKRLELAGMSGIAEVE